MVNRLVFEIAYILINKMHDAKMQTRGPKIKDKKRSEFSQNGGSIYGQKGSKHGGKCGHYRYFWLKTLLFNNLMSEVKQKRTYMC